jgi:hypothetical protein
MTQDALQTTGEILVCVCIWNVQRKEILWLSPEIAKENMTPKTVRKHRL